MEELFEAGMPIINLFRYFGNFYKARSKKN